MNVEFKKVNVINNVSTETLTTQLLYPNSLPVPSRTKETKKIIKKL